MRQGFKPLSDDRAKSESGDRQLQLLACRLALWGDRKIIYQKCLLNSVCVC
ncbi:MAG: hypothetical protein JGK17_07310 [Microcoleus sp. PH2017_10_PVI_O_A]|uniref:hypothetical protein n=1 Tax=unclassified Microcoleus TaxID=2642155 RepID=UPI001D5299AA|nr:MULTISPECIES: hypothetical protein [unclassified Microcoleus]MCC3405392.1 hypothetical protein [Microcoleus sp. PH2017_10_PVI_O_A]MCC3463963.1 hypothetical protein [Microcoleus sp. PH2017_11_PCY_U_A]MCC3482288.1 hypothetical protein [Microcoleus sp. PH2017_12_PCY_D_A]MCC3532131.1 hypothetical protein [Microcoleus sp. PH2017_21_RUC_O_A]MCC3544431.1 hypothetical protein [Microcoleus sp. PH2017_22_RUC_O_B]